MRKRPTFRFCCLVCWRGCCLTANCILTGILAIQAVIAILLLTSPDLPVPKFLESRINRSFESHELTASWENAYIDLRGRLSVDGLALHHRFDQDQLLRIGTARIDINWLALRDREEVLIESVLARDIRLYGRNSLDPVLRLSNLELDHGRTWHLQEAAGRWQGINFFAAGPIPTELPQQEPQPDQPLAQRLRQAAEKIESIAAQLPPIEGAGLQVRLLPATDSLPEWQAQAYLSSVQFPEPAVRVDGLLLDASGWINPAYAWREAALHVRNLQYQDATAHHLELTALPGDPEWLATGTLRVEDLAQRDIRLQNTLLHWQAPRLTEGESTWQLEAVTNAIGGLWTASGQFDTARKSGSIDLFTEIDPDNILGLPRLNLEKAQKEVRFEGTSRVEAQIELLEDAQLGPIDLQVRLDGLTVRDVTFDWGVAHGRMADGWLHLEDIQVTSGDGQHAVGAFGQSLDSRDFYLRFEGNLYPQSLNPMFGNWYDSLWEGLNIPGPPPWASIQVRSSWGLDYAHRHQLALDMRDILYRDQPLEVVDLRIRQNDDQIQLVHLDARSGPGRAITGQVSWQLDPADPAYRVQRVNIRSTLPVPALEAALKLAPGTVSERLQSPNKPPRVAFSGQIRTEIESRTQTPYIDFSFSNDTPFTTFTLPVDSLVMEGSLKDKLISLTKVKGQVFGGAADATANLKMQPEAGPIFDLQLTLKDANYTRAITWIQNRGKDAPEATPANPDAPPGLLNLSTTLHGQGAQTETYSGQGHLKISEAELQRVRLLGGLSRLLEEVGITITTSPLRELETELQLTSGDLTLPDVSISGPGLRIRADGTVSLPTQALDFNVRASPGVMRGTIVGNVVTGLLSPLGGVLEMRVTGTLSDPDWGWKWNPFRGSGSPPAEKAKETAPAPKSGPANREP
ncbi:MAG: AsmA-like C-terminal region-containing protein [Verrucomicrobiota bacterium JB022]|nr:AsmA-like C-terminal region-containing protein [Verrucomicrobiota bacterium JB022]